MRPPVPQTTKSPKTQPRGANEASVRPSDMDEYRERIARLIDDAFGRAARKTAVRR